jgi:glycosyltransferase involved in cell wall biosynthesis
MTFNGKLGLVQRVLPVYRAPFFDALAAACTGGLDVFAGEPRPDESIVSADELKTAFWTHADNLHLLRGPLYLCYQRGLMDWLKECQSDALIVEANPRYLATSSAVKGMHTRGKPVIGWGLGAPPPEGWTSGLRRSARLRFLHQFDALISYSARGAEQYAQLGYPADRIFVAPNATAPAPSLPMPVRADSFGDRPVVLYVGRLQARKRLDDLIRACAALPEVVQPRLVIVGDGPERERLEALARQVYPSVEFAGAKFGAELAPYFTAADLFVLPGTGGLAVQEAMSYGLPVIVARGDGTQDDLVRPGNGWQIPVEDFPALLNALQTALSDPAKLRNMGKESYLIVADEINIEKMVGVFIEALNSVCKRPAGY